MSAPGLVEVAKTATCRRCGAEQVAWVQSKRGKWYLCEALHDPTGVIIAQRFKFHRCPEAEA